MKKVLFILVGALLLMISQVQATAPKTKEVKSAVKAATVFLSGAQVTRTSKVVVESGTSILKFINISPNIDKQSLQVDGEGDFTILSVQHQMKEYEEEKEQNAEIEKLQQEIKDLKEKIKDEEAMLFVYDEELNLIKSHRNFNHPKEGIKVSDLQQAADFYRTRLKEIKLGRLGHNRAIDGHRLAIGEAIKKINAINKERKPFEPFSEVYVTVHAKRSLTVDFKVSYLVPQAAWYPSYDLRVKDVNSPMKIGYKATVFQMTGEDWNDSKLTLSTANPSQTGVKPTLQMWQLGYYNRPYASRNPTYDQPVINTGAQGAGQTRTITGVITDRQTGEPLIGANVVIDGTTVGAVTDFNGRYTLTGSIHPNSTLSVSYVGYTTQKQAIGNRYSMNYAMQEGAVLTEVVTTASKKPTKRDWGKTKEAERPAATTRPTSTPVAVKQTNKVMSVTFEIELPYSIPSNGKEYTVNIQQLEIPAEYQYACVPKLDLNVYLTAKITDWQNFNLLNGNVNLFFEGTFLNKSYLDLTNAKDTLEISLGRDKDIVVKRTKLKNSSKRQFIGSDKIDTRSWEIAIENRKKQTINLIVEDQIPVVYPTQSENIEVTLKKDSGAEHNKKTGQLLWKLKMAAKAEKELEFRYEVKYPKTTNLALE